MTDIDPPYRSLADPARLAALDALAVLDTPTEQGFDDVVRLAARLCAAPVALVSLVAADRQWFKARIGFPHCETDLDRSVCKLALVERDLLVILDLAADPATAANPLVTGDPHIRFYAGAPLRLTDGHVVGSLCVIDTVPRPGGLSPEQADDLRALGRQVSVLLETRRAVERRDRVLDGQRAEVRQARRLDVLAQASAALLGASDAAGVLEPILTTGAAALGFDQCFIYDVDPGERHPRLVRSIGTDEATPSALASVALDVPLCGLVVKSRRALVLNALQAGTEPLYATARDAGVDAYAGYPITSRGRIAGVVSFTSTREPAFDAEALAFFAALTRLMSGVRERLDTDAALRASDTRSRLAQEAGRIGTFEMDVTSGLMSVSPEFARLYGVPAGNLHAAERFEALVVPEDRALASSEASRRAGDAVLDVEYRIRRADDGELRWIARRAAFVRDPAGTVVRMFGTVQDVTDAKRASLRQAALVEIGDRLRDLDAAPEMIRVGAEVMARMLGAARAGYGPINPDRMTMEIPDDWCAPGVASVAGLHDLRAFGAYAEDMKRGELVVVDDLEVAPRDQDAADVLMSMGIRMMVNVPIMERGRLVGAGFVHYAQLRPVPADDLAFVRTVVDRMQIALARVKAEEQQALLNGELSHRLKNTLSMVQGIAAQTLRGVPDQAPVLAFTQRLIALSQAHDVLLQDSWAAAPIQAVVERVLLLQAPLTRFRIAGANLALLPQATLSLSLLLHELTTNAVKYGALSTGTGTVDVAWRIEGDGERTIVLTWQEHGGPPAQAPTHRGFGTRLIQIGLVGTRDTRLSYTELGFDAEFRAPGSEVVAS